jgi:large subunit ribosomal protein L4
VYLGNQRQASAKTKTRGEVAKTTAKMYRQKGTGRARHGSYSAPIFVGGGIAHGPDGRQNYKHRLSTSQSRQALFVALSGKVKSDLVVITGTKSLGKTKEAEKMVEKIAKEGEKLLVVVAIGQATLARAIRNLKNVSVSFSNQLNTYTILRHKKMAVTAEALEELTKTFIKK